MNRDNGLVNRNTPYTNQAIGSSYNRLNNHQNVFNNIYSGHIMEFREIHQLIMATVIQHL